MIVSKSWLSEYLDLEKYSDKDLYDIFTSHINEVETMTHMIEANNLTIGLIKECIMHPDSDHLHICQVEVRENEVLQIVCGAPNAREGIKVIVANIGAVLPGNFKIKKSTIRGVESNGMLCSLQELGIDEKYVPEKFKNGIYECGDDAKVGENALEYLNMNNDTIFDLELTSNRSDLLSVRGVVYDLACATSQKPKFQQYKLEEDNELNPVEIKIETDKCHKYLARYIKGVKIEESPMWLKAKLIKSGIRPISNVVDITNLVLMEFGQPLHSFDADKLGNNILVRNAHENEELITLDDVKRNLRVTDIVITDGNDAVCLGGVMGGVSTEVDTETKNIILEAAYFDPLSIRKTSQTLNLKSESSIRFERKIDYNRVDEALDYAAYLIKEIAGGKILKGVSSDIKVKYEEKHVDITLDKINSVLGTKLDNDYIYNLFERLNYKFEYDKGVYHITLPSRRMDLEESPQDVIEDVARMYGYENIPTTLAKTESKGGLTFSQKRIRNIREILSSMGLKEIVSYSLIKETDLGLYVDEIKNPVKVLMPLTEDRNVMRESLLNGLVDTVRYNLARKNENLAFFEIGNVYFDNNEELHLGIALNGTFTSLLWNGKKMDASFYLLKGIIEELFNRLNVKATYETKTANKTFHPGRCAKIILRGEEVGFISELHPKFAKDNDVAGTVVLEIKLAKVLLENNNFKYHSINKYPSIERDIAIVVDKDVLVSDIEKSIKKASSSHLTKIEIFDLYEGINIGITNKSLAFRLTFEDNNKTLEAKEVDKDIENILIKLGKDFNALLR